MARIQESYKGRNIVIQEPEQKPTEEIQEPRLNIDGQPVRVIHNSDGTYSSEVLFYTKYASLLELARAGIDSLPPKE